MFEKVKFLTVVYFQPTWLVVEFRVKWNEFQQGSAMEAKTTSDLYQRDRIEQAKQILQPYILRRLKANVRIFLKNRKTIKILGPDLPAQQIWNGSGSGNDCGSGGALRAYFGIVGFPLIV